MNSEENWGLLRPQIVSQNKPLQIRIKLKAVEHLKKIRSKSDTDFWGTPPDKLMQIKKLLGYEPEIDYASTVPMSVCRECITPERDALTMEWTKDGFGNWPYSEIERWMKYSVEQWQINNINLLILTFSKTDTEWWHKYIEPYRLNGKAIVIFQKGRLRFRDEWGFIGENSAPYGSAWIFYKKKN